MDRGTKLPCGILALMCVCVSAQCALAQEPDAPLPLAPLSAAENPPDAAEVALGRMLFFDKRLSGDATLSCADCHSPEQAWTDGLPLSRGYPGTLYFRNTPTLLNVRHQKRFYWDGRLSGDDLPTLMRDHISESHFLWADGRLVIERLRQIPEYEERFQATSGGEPSYGRILSALAAFVSSLESTDVPLDQFLEGDAEALSESAQRGLELFRGQAGCIRCHDGPLLSDGQFHSLGLQTSSDIFQSPERHITFRRFFRTLGVPGFGDLRQDVGLMALTKRAEDVGSFRTPSLREVTRTGPYMHDGQLESLADVVAFYNAGGGAAGQKDDLLEPLNLDEQEQQDLLEFLNALAGTVGDVSRPELPEYEVRRVAQPD